MASMAVSMVPWAVTTMTGVWPRARTRLSNSSPSMRGIFRSVMTQSKERSSSFFSAASPSLAATTPWPALLKIAPRLSRMKSSSSTISTVAMTRIMRQKVTLSS